MGVRVGDQRVPIQPTNAPAHGRVGGEASLQREDVGRQIIETLLHRIKARLGAEDGKPGCPDVGRDEIALRIGLQHNFQQITRIQPQDRAAIRANVTDAFQPCLQPFQRGKGGHKDQVVDFANGVVFLVDVADLTTQQKAHRPLTGGWHLGLDGGQQVSLQAKQPFFRRFQLFFQFGQPAGVSNIAGGNQVDALPLRPETKMFQIQIFAGGA